MYCDQKIITILNIGTNFDKFLSNGCKRAISSNPLNSNEERNVFLSIFQVFELKSLLLVRNGFRNFSAQKKMNSTLRLYFKKSEMSLKIRRFLYSFFFLNLIQTLCQPVDFVTWDVARSSTMIKQNLCAFLLSHFDSSKLNAFQYSNSSSYEIYGVYVKCCIGYQEHIYMRV